MEKTFFNLLYIVIALIHANLSSAFISPKRLHHSRSLSHASTTSSADDVSTRRIVDVEADVREVGDNDSTNKLIAQLLDACKSSNRGQREGDRYRIEKELIPRVEAVNIPFSSVSEETLQTMLSQRGKETLVYTNDDLTRASPFFWAFAKACQGVRVGNDNDISKQIFRITDSVPPPLKSIGSVEQYFTAEGKLISQIEVKTLAGLSSLMTTTSGYKVIDPAAGLVELNVESTKILRAKTGKILSILEKIVDKEFPSNLALELVTPGSSTVYFQLTYLDSNTRIIRTKNASRQEDEKIFIFTTQNS